MKTYGLFGRKDLHIEQREQSLPDPGHGQVIVRVRACGICGTDLNFLRQWEQDPMPLGHEISGEVVEVGPGVTRLKPGDKVVVEDCTLCGTCDDCKKGRSDLCQNMSGLDGQSGLGEYLLLGEQSLVTFDHMPFATAALTEPLAVCLNSVLQANIPLGGSVMVLGGGPLGLMTAAVARLRGAGFVGLSINHTDTPVGKARLEAANSLSLDLVANVDQSPLKDVLSKTHPKGVDRVIVTSPPKSLHDAVTVTAYGGSITYFGVAFNHESKVTLDFTDLLFRKISIQPFFAEPAINFPLSRDLLQRGAIPTERILNHSFSPDSLETTLKGLAQGTIPAVKATLVREGKA